MASTIILSDNGASSGSAGLKQTAGNDGVLLLQTTTSGGTATTAVTIDTSQNLGLGVTPSTWGSGWTGLQFGPSGSAANSGTGTPVTAISNNAYYNGTNWVYINTAAAAQYQLSTSQHIWRYAASNSGNITWSEAMRLDASGNLGIGTSSPAYRLDVIQAGASTISSAFAMARITGANATANDLTLIGPNTSQVRINFGDTDAENIGEIGYNHSSNSMRFVTNGSQRASFDSSGNLLVGTTTAKQQLTVANLGHFAGRTQVGAAFIGDDATGGNNRGIVFGSGGLFPSNGSGTASDNSYDLGSSSYRWKVVYAGTGTINTSDANAKQDVYYLDDAEKRVAVAIKSLIKKYRFKDAVLEKGDSARIHVGVMAQDVAAAFVSEGLDPSRYALFCSDTWYEVDGEAMDENVKPYTSEAKGAVSVTRLGIRYDELLAFVLAAI